MQTKNKYTFGHREGLAVTVMSTSKEGAIEKLGREVGFKGAELPIEWRLLKIDIR